ncbi:unnamed protein product [Amoebophrya sp. A120]|nr:unnamed protein product [Amoebophrya sp. A120]|eukprot:GSA120T00004048001.1
MGDVHQIQKPQRLRVQTSGSRHYAHYAARQASRQRLFGLATLCSSTCSVVFGLGALSPTPASEEPDDVDFQTAASSASADSYAVSFAGEDERFTPVIHQRGVDLPPTCGSSSGRDSCPGDQHQHQEARRLPDNINQHHQPNDEADAAAGHGNVVRHLRVPISGSAPSPPRPRDSPRHSISNPRDPYAGAPLLLHQRRPAGVAQLQDDEAEVAAGAQSNGDTAAASPVHAQTSMTSSAIDAVTRSRLSSAREDAAAPASRPGSHLQGATMPGAADGSTAATSPSTVTAAAAAGGADIIGSAHPHPDRREQPQPRPAQELYYTNLPTTPGPRLVHKNTFLELVDLPAEDGEEDQNGEPRAGGVGFPSPVEKTSGSTMTSCTQTPASFGRFPSSACSGGSSRSRALSTPPGFFAEFLRLGKARERLSITEADGAGRGSRNYVVGATTPIDAASEQQAFETDEERQLYYSHNARRDGHDENATAQVADLFPPNGAEYRPISSSDFLPRYRRSSAELGLTGFRTNRRVQDGREDDLPDAAGGTSRNYNSSVQDTASFFHGSPSSAAGELQAAPSSSGNNYTAMEDRADEGARMLWHDSPLNGPSSTEAPSPDDVGLMDIDLSGANSTGGDRYTEELQPGQGALLSHEDETDVDAAHIWGDGFATPEPQSPTAGGSYAPSFGHAMLHQIPYVLVPSGGASNPVEEHHMNQGDTVQQHNLLLLAGPRATESSENPPRDGPPGVQQSTPRTPSNRDEQDDLHLLPIAPRLHDVHQEAIASVEAGADKISSARPSSNATLSSSHRELNASAKTFDPTAVAHDIVMCANVAAADGARYFQKHLADFQRAREEQEEARLSPETVETSKAQQVERSSSASEPPPSMPAPALQPESAASDHLDLVTGMLQEQAEFQDAHPAAAQSAATQLYQEAYAQMEQQRQLAWQQHYWHMVQVYPMHEGESVEKYQQRLVHIVEMLQKYHLQTCLYQQLIYQQVLLQKNDGHQRENGAGSSASSGLPGSSTDSHFPYPHHQQTGKNATTSSSWSSSSQASKMIPERMRQNQTALSNLQQQIQKLEDEIKSAIGYSSSPQRQEEEATARRNVVESAKPVGHVRTRKAEIRERQAEETWPTDVTALEQDAAGHQSVKKQKERLRRGKKNDQNVNEGPGQEKVHEDLEVLHLDNLQKENGDEKVNVATPMLELASPNAKSKGNIKGTNKKAGPTWVPKKVPTALPEGSDSSASVVPAPIETATPGDTHVAAFVQSPASVPPSTASSRARKLGKDAWFNLSNEAEDEDDIDTQIFKTNPQIMPWTEKETPSPNLSNEAELEGLYDPQSAETDLLERRAEMQNAETERLEQQMREQQQQSLLRRKQEKAAPPVEGGGGTAPPPVQDLYGQQTQGMLAMQQMRHSQDLSSYSSMHFHHLVPYQQEQLHDQYGMQLQMQGGAAAQLVQQAPPGVHLPYQCNFLQIDQYNHRGQLTPEADRILFATAGYLANPAEGATTIFIPALPAHFNQENLADFLRTVIPEARFNMIYMPFRMKDFEYMCTQPPWSDEGDDWAPYYTEQARRRKGDPRNGWSWTRCASHPSEEDLFPWYADDFKVRRARRWHSGYAFVNFVSHSDFLRAMNHLSQNWSSLGVYQDNYVDKKAEREKLEATAMGRPVLVDPRRKPRQAADQGISMYLLKDKNALRSPMMRMTKSVAPKFFRFWGQPQFYDSPAVDAQAVPREQIKAYWDKLCAFHRASSKAPLSLPAALGADGGPTITYAPTLAASSSTSAPAAGQQSGGRGRNHRASRSGRGRDYHHRSQLVEENGLAEDYYLQQKFQ